MSELIQELVTAQEGGFPPPSLVWSASCTTTTLQHSLGLAVSSRELSWPQRGACLRVWLSGKGDGPNWVSHWPVSAQDPARSRASLLPTDWAVRSAHTTLKQTFLHGIHSPVFYSELHSLSTLQSIDYCWWNASNILLPKHCRCTPPSHIACPSIDSQTPMSLFHGKVSDDLICRSALHSSWSAAVLLWHTQKTPSTLLEHSIGISHHFFHLAVKNREKKLDPKHIAFEFHRLEQRTLIFGGQTQFCVLYLYFRVQKHRSSTRQTGA